MNTSLLMVHWISMFLAFTGGIMLAVWCFKNLKAQQLLILVIAVTVLGLFGSALTFQAELEFLTKLHGQKSMMMEGENDRMNIADMDNMNKMMDMMKNMEEKMDTMDGKIEKMMDNK